ncbi:hypothetical protein CTEN210_11481 [Chaetoceros tenuissimus]|uniref:Uncharacterized protein n=1 Tax=Chaetoceros tenuissimus TaxID=426638 RepID=A0AAD3D1L8_9STRA|nr:hypothetical protein CTEN210_11481 [Chaetoceros tenuissimus]
MTLAADDAKKKKRIRFMRLKRLFHLKQRKEKVEGIVIDSDGAQGEHESKHAVASVTTPLVLRDNRIRNMQENGIEKEAKLNTYLRERGRIRFLYTFILMILIAVYLMTHQELFNSKLRKKLIHQQEKLTKQKYSQAANDNFEKLMNNQLPSKIPKGCQGTLLLLPHCDSRFSILYGSSEDDDHCNYLGLQRSYYLITQFGKNRRWNIPKDIYIFGSRYSSQRAIETMNPLQNYYSIRGRTSPVLFDDKNVLVQEISALLKGGNMCGQTVTITTASNSDIPVLAMNLGCGPLNAGAGCPMKYEEQDFDSVWELRFVFDEFGNQGLNYTLASNPLLRGKDIEHTLRWRVYGNVVKERFDPLAFSKKVGEFQRNATLEEKPRWMDTNIYATLQT